MVDEYPDRRNKGCNINMYKFSAARNPKHPRLRRRHAHASTTISVENRRGVTRMTKILELYEKEEAHKSSETAAKNRNKELS